MIQIPKAQVQKQRCSAIKPSVDTNQDTILVLVSRHLQIKKYYGFSLTFPFSDLNWRYLFEETIYFGRSPEIPLFRLMRPSFVFRLIL